ncbi:MAG: hypothetical protein WCA59_07615 [Candidatus Binataceae bacterium]
MNRERIVQIFFFGLVGLITYGLFRVLEPFLIPIAWAILLAFLAHPAQTQLNRLVRNRTATAAIISFAIALGVILPAIYLSACVWRIADLCRKSVIRHTQGQVGLALWRRVDVSRRFSPPETVFPSAIFYVLCTNSTERALKKGSRES